MTDKDTGSVPKTIDSNGNIVPKSNGLSRWARPRFYPCAHEDCPKAAIFTKAVPDYIHNCCNEHEEGVTHE